MWAEFGKRVPFGRRFPLTHSVEASAVGSASSFSKRAFPQLKAETFGIVWWRGPDIKKEAGWWWTRNRHDVMLLVLGNKCCDRDWLGVLLEQGYKYGPLVFVIGIEQFHNKPAPCQLSSPFSRVVESSRGAIDPSTFVSTGNLVSCLVSCGGFRPWCK
jgi:hypothetical protein